MQILPALIRKRGVILAASIAAGLHVSADPLVASSYTATPGEGTAEGGLYNYFDDTGTQLADGVFGANAWFANLGNGVAYEWVGWRVADPVITFQFADTESITGVGIDFNRTETNMISLPSQVTIGTTQFTVSPDSIGDNSRGTVLFNGSWTGTTLTIQLADFNTNQWIFVDEITLSTTPVPEPAVWALLAGSGLFVFLSVRKRSPSRRLLA